MSNFEKIMVLAAILMFSLIIGCGSSGEKSIAKVDDYDISTEEFKEYYSRVQMTFPTAQDEYNNRRELLDSLIVTRLLVKAAYEKGIDQLEEINRVIMVNKDKFLLDALYDEHIASQIEPTEAEIRNYFDKQEFRIRASHILVADIDTAQSIFERIKAGENFDQLAFQYSIDPSAQRNHGDLGYFTWGAMVDEFQEAAFAMDAGQLSPPVKSKFGYHIIKLVDKVANTERPEYDQAKESIRVQVRGRKNYEVSNNYFKMIKEKYKITIEKETCDYLLHKREQMYPPQLLAQLPKNDFDLEQLDRDEKELVIATLDGGNVTIGDYLTSVKDIPAQYRPNLNDYDSLAVVIFELKKLDILALEAIREGLDNNEKYLKTVNLFKELTMADILKNDSIPVPAAPDDGMIRSYFDANPDEFTDPAKVRIYEILISDELKAKKLIKEVSGLDNFKEVARELTERPGKRSQSGDMGYIEEKWYPDLFETAYQTRIGGVAGPIFTNQKYSIIFVIDKIEATLKDFLGQKRTIKEKLIRDQKVTTMQNWVDSMLKVTDVDVDETALWETVDEAKYGDAGNVGN